MNAPKSFFRRQMCSACWRRARISTLRPFHTTPRTLASTKEDDDFYQLLLSYPLPSPSITTRPSPSTPTPSNPSSTTSPTHPPSSDRADLEARARIVFGSRLAGPAHRADLLTRSKTINGILIPPRPSEPDNCCMSGCVNCVWDRYRDDLEEWAARTKQARLVGQHTQQERERFESGRVRYVGRDLGSGEVGNESGEGKAGTGGLAGDAKWIGRPGGSMDDDGGGSEALWGGADGAVGERVEDDGGALFAGVPVGIREFMRTEKRLRERRRGREKARIAAG